MLFNLSCDEVLTEKFHYLGDKQYATHIRAKRVNTISLFLKFRKTIKT